MIDVWCDVRVNGNRKATRGRLIEHDGNLVLFSRNDQVQRFDVESVDKARRTATLSDGGKLVWRPGCSTCSQPVSLKGPASTLLAKLNDG